MNELEQAFEELATDEDNKLTEMLSGNTTEESGEEESEAEQAEEAETEEAEEEVETPVQTPATKAVMPRGVSWEKQLKELSEFTGEGFYGLESLRSLPNYSEMHTLMRGGATLLQAYKAVNFDSIMRTQVQKERNKIRGKAHLKASRGGADANEVVVPNDVYRAFKMLEPKMSDEEIRQYYKKTRSE